MSDWFEKANMASVMKAMLGKQEEFQYYEIHGKIKVKSIGELAKICDAIMLDRHNIEIDCKNGIISISEKRDEK